MNSKRSSRMISDEARLKSLPIRWFTIMSGFLFLVAFQTRATDVYQNPLPVAQSDLLFGFNNYTLQ